MDLSAYKNESVLCPALIDCAQVLSHICWVLIATKTKLPHAQVPHVLFDDDGWGEEVPCFGEVMNETIQCVDLLNTFNSGGKGQT